MNTFALRILKLSTADNLKEPPACAVTSLWQVIFVSPSTSIFASLPTKILQAPFIEMSAFPAIEIYPFLSLQLQITPING